MRSSLSPAAPLWVALGAGGSGVLTYVMLIATANGLGGAEFDAFSFYWAILVALSVGGFLPVEQLLARRVARADALAQLLRWGATWCGVTAALGTVVLASAGVWRDQVSPLAVAVFAVNLVAVGAQAAARGVAAGRHRLDVYAAIAMTDAVVRSVLCGALAVAGVEVFEAYAAALAAGCLLGLAVGAWMLRGPGGHLDGTPVAAGAMSREALSLVPAMLSMQLLLNSPIFVAFAVRDALSPGTVLAVGSLVRIPVFAAQAAQAAYVARIAAVVGVDDRRVAGLVAVVRGLVVALAALTVVGAAAFGPWAVPLLFGAEFEVTRVQSVLAGAGVALFLVAIVSNDLAVARGLHRLSGRYWVIGALVAAASLVVLRGDVLVFGPLVVGSAVALTLVLVGSRPVDAGRPVVRRTGTWPLRR